MRKFLLIFMCAIMSFFANAQQNNQKYLEGAVPEVNGKVVFTKTISVKEKIADDRLFVLMDQWAQNNYNSTGNLPNRVLLSNADTRSIACSGEKYLIFQNTALSLDRAKMSFQLIIEVGGNKCDVTVRNIKYEYANNKDPMTAENMITDKSALNKNKDKLNRYYDKFRTHTIDTINNIFNSIDIYLNGTSTAGVVSSLSNNVSAATSQHENTTLQTPVETAPQVVPTPISVVSQPNEHIVEVASPVNTTDNTAMPGYRLVTADKIPGNIIKLLSDAMLITSGTSDQINVMAASWGGLGRFWEKPVAFCFLNPSRYSVQTMDKGDTYTLSFYTEAYRDAVMYCGSLSGRDTDKIKGSGLTPIKTPSGASAFSEAWLIIECKKLVAQPLSPDAVVAKDLPSDWTKNGYHKMYIGEILNVWVK